MESSKGKIVISKIDIKSCINSEAPIDVMFGSDNDKGIIHGFLGDRISCIDGGEYSVLKREYPYHVVGIIKEGEAFELSMEVESKGIVDLIREYRIHPKYWDFIVNQALIGKEFDFNIVEIGDAVGFLEEYADLNLPITPMTVEEYKMKLYDKYKDRLEWFEKQFPKGLFTEDNSGSPIGVTLITRVFLKEMDEMEQKRKIWIDEDVKALALRMWGQSEWLKEADDCEKWWNDNYKLDK